MAYSSPRGYSEQPCCFGSRLGPSRDFFFGVKAIERNTRPTTPEDLNAYTDIDLANDLNALRLEDRQAMEEDIHGVSGVIPETEEFVEAKIKEMNAHISMISPREKQAWERAVYLRPSLQQDKALRLLCLRARRFQPKEAAKALIIMFEDKQLYFGEDLVLQRITWDDLTDHEHKIIRSGIYQLIPSQETTGRGIAFGRMSQWDTPNNHMAYSRCLYYIQSAIIDDVEMQKRGVVTVVDYRGEWKSTPLDILRFVQSLPDERKESFHFFEACTHILYDSKSLEPVIHFFRQLFEKAHHLRYRTHSGSSIEMQYSLRAFGIHFSGVLGEGDKAGPLFDKLLEADIQNRQKLDKKWRDTEAPFHDPSSPIALFPNKQDVLMGRNKMIASSWPGNVAYHKLIGLNTERYVDAQAGNRFHLTVIGMEIMHIVQREYKGRFLLRGDNCWEVCEDALVQKKIGQALRMRAKSLGLGQ